MKFQKLHPLIVFIIFIIIIFQERLWMETLITKNWNEKSVAKIIKVDIESAIPEGQNYCSIIIRAEIMVTLRNRQMSKLCFIIKKARETMKTTADNSNLNAEFLVNTVEPLRYLLYWRNER